MGVLTLSDLAIAYGVDPTPVEALVQFKNALKQAN